MPTAPGWPYGASRSAGLGDPRHPLGKNTALKRDGVRSPERGQEGSGLRDPRWRLREGCGRRSQPGCVPGSPKGPPCPPSPASQKRGLWLSKMELFLCLCLPRTATGACGGWRGQDEGGSHPAPSTPSPPPSREHHSGEGRKNRELNREEQTKESNLLLSSVMGGWPVFSGVQVNSKGEKWASSVSSLHGRGHGRGRGLPEGAGGCCGLMLGWEQVPPGVNPGFRGTSPAHLLPFLFLFSAPPPLHCHRLLGSQLAWVPPALPPRGTRARGVAQLPAREVGE